MLDGHVGSDRRSTGPHAFRAAVRQADAEPRLPWLEAACPRVLQCQIGRTECPRDPTLPLRAFHSEEATNARTAPASWPWTRRSRVEPRLALRPTVPAEARSTPTERTTRRGHALTATRSTVGPVSPGRGPFTRSGPRPDADPSRVARAPEHVTARALRPSVQRTRRTDLRTRTRAGASPPRPAGAAPDHRRPPA